MPMVITEDVAETMALANLGPRWNTPGLRELPDCDYNEILGLQLMFEHEYGVFFVSNAKRIMSEMGFEGEVILTKEHWRTTRTPMLTDNDDTYERFIWQTAHDVTSLPKCWG